MSAAGVDIVELGLRSAENTSFKGACAFTTDRFLNTLRIPNSLKVGVMINANELIENGEFQEYKLEKLFPNNLVGSKLSVVRVACHTHEFEKALPAARWLKDKGYSVGFNLMQISERSEQEIKQLAILANQYPLDVLYFADSMGSMNPEKTQKIIEWLKTQWKGDLGIHTHDNMGLALSNTLRAVETGCTWLDSTVTGMGRGPGNARTEELAIELAEKTGRHVNLVPLMTMITKDFKPMQQKCGWGTNTYYYLAGKYGIHPTYIQEMLNDPRYDEEDLLAVIDHLRIEGGKSFSLQKLNTARSFYKEIAAGEWSPKDLFENKEVLLLGSGPGVQKHRSALEAYIKERSPLVLALNTQNSVSAELISLRIACHPVRLLADGTELNKLPQPLITPYSMLPEEVQKSLSHNKILDFGLRVQADSFEFNQKWCTTPNPLVVAYALATATSGNAKKILLAGFDGYGADDPRTKEMQELIKQYQATAQAIPLLSITKTRYSVETKSIYAL